MVKIVGPTQVALDGIAAANLLQPKFVEALKKKYGVVYVAHISLEVAVDEKAAEQGTLSGLIGHGGRKDAMSGRGFVAGEGVDMTKDLLDAIEATLGR